MGIGGLGELFALFDARGRAVAAVGFAPGGEVVGGEEAEVGEDLGTGEVFGEEGVVEEAQVARHFFAGGLAEARGEFKDVGGGHPDGAGEAVLLDSRGEGFLGGLAAGEAFVAALAEGALAH